MSQTRGAQRRSIRQTFDALRAAGQVGLVPFLPAGYPDLELTAAALPALEASGASAIEIGFPFSDPVADGPTIQQAYTEALRKKIKVADVFAAVRNARAGVGLPLVGMVSYSITFRHGVTRFVAEAREAGFDGLIIPDLPPPEAQRVCDLIRGGGLDTVLLVAPTTTLERRRQIAQLSSGFVYYLSVSGITGERDRLPADLTENLRQLRGITDTPLCVGFGISQPQHLAQLRGLADGAIVGSAFVKRVQAHHGEGSEAITGHIQTYARELLSLVDPVPR